MIRHPSMVRSLASVVSATDQPSPRPPIWLSAARAASARNTSLKIDSAGHLPDGPHLDAGLVHLDDEVGQPGVLGHDRGRCGRRGCRSRAMWAPDVHTFWPLTTHSSPSRSARVWSAGQVGAGPGSENSWHQISPVTMPGRKPGLLLGRAVGDDGRAGQVLGDAGGRRRRPARRARASATRRAASAGQAPAVGPLRPCGEPPTRTRPGAATSHVAAAPGPSCSRTRPWPRRRRRRWRRTPPGETCALLVTR